MSATAVTVWFDYACPHSSHGLRQLEDVASGIGFDIDRRPFLLRADSLALPTASVDRSGVAHGQGRRPLYQPGEGTGTEPASNRSVSTLAVHAATAYAKERGLDGRFFWAASKEYWEQGIDLSSLYNLRRLSLVTGIDWAEIWPELESGRYHRLVLEQHEGALAAGVVRTPSFLIGGRLHSGPIAAEDLRAAVQAAR